MTPTMRTRRPPPRVRCIRTPNPNISITATTVVVIACIASVGILHSPLTELIKRFSTDTGTGPTAETTALCLSLLLGPPIVFVAYVFLRDMQLERLTPFRARRLKAIATHPKASARLPHRLVEYAFRGKTPSRHTFARLMECLPPGLIVVIAAKMNPGMPPASALAFEPINIEEDEARLRELAWSVHDAAQFSSHLKSDSVTHVATSHTLRTILTFALSRIAMLAWALFFLTSAIRTRSWTLGAGCAGMTLLFFSYPWLRSFFVEDRWYLAPQTLIHHDYRAWPRRDARVAVRASDFPIILNAWDGKGRLQVGDDPITFPAPARHIPSIVAALQSAAPAPTEAELKSYFGVE